MPLNPQVSALVEKIYQRDKHHYRKLMVWVRDARRRKWSDDRIARALRALDQKLDRAEPVPDWWAYLNRSLEWIRTRDIHRENEGFKHQRPNAVRAILKQILGGLE